MAVMHIEHSRDWHIAGQTVTDPPHALLWACDSPSGTLLHIITSPDVGKTVNVASSENNLALTQMTKGCL